MATAHQNESEWEASDQLKHIAIIMDGNGRWAHARGLPRHVGHRAGVKAARCVVEACAKRGVSVLTLFAFSSENWRRPKQEVGMLMRLFVEALQREMEELHKNDVRLRVIGGRGSLSLALQNQIRHAEELTKQNRGLQLVIAVDYGGRWDIVQAVHSIARRTREGELDPKDIDESLVAKFLSLRDLPDPDLFIRTGGERRISNFLLWNLAYTELIFSDVLWPEFGEDDLDAALRVFANRQRRFGRLAEQSGAS